MARGKFVIGEEVKKMGRTWIITEQAMIKSFGALKFEEYKKKQQKKEQVKEKKLNGVYSNRGLNTQKTSKCSGQKRNRSSKKVHSMNEKEDGSGYETVLEVKKYDCMSMTRKYDFIGIYTPQSGLGQDDASAVYVLNMEGGIQVITTDETGGTLKTGIYDLQGRKLSKEPTHGIYIKNGKKVMILL